MDISLLTTYDYFDSLNYRYKMARAFPFISAYSIGKSVMGREIPAYILGDAEEYALFVGGIHGNAHFTSTILMAFFFEICQAFLNDGAIEGLKVKRALSGRGLAVVPCLNPDGCEIALKGKSAFLNMQNTLEKLTKGNCSDFSLNARGVDLDRVFALNPNKESESAALFTFCETHPIRHAVAFDEGEKQIFAPRLAGGSDRSLAMSEIMISSTGYNLSRTKSSQSVSDFAEWFSSKYEKPAFALLSERPNKNEYIKRYCQLREFMILTAIM